MKHFISFLLNQIQNKKIKWLLIKFNTNFQYLNRRTKPITQRNVLFSLKSLNHFPEIQLVFKIRHNNHKVKL